MSDRSTEISVHTGSEWTFYLKGPAPLMGKSYLVGKAYEEIARHVARYGYSVPFMGNDTRTGEGMAKAIRDSLGTSAGDLMITAKKSAVMI